MEESERMFRFPYPLRKIGYYLENSNSVRRKWAAPITFRRDEYQFALRMTSICSGMSQTINGKKYDNTFPHVILKCPGHLYTNEHPYDTPESLCISYQAEVIRPFFPSDFFTAPLAWNVSLPPYTLKLIQTIMENLPVSQDCYVADRLDLLCLQLIEELLPYRYRKEQAGGRGQTDSIRKIASYFQMNFSRVIDLESVIEKHGMSRSSFFRNWNAVYGISPVRYVNNLRMAEASRLLLETEYTLAHIANILGFQNVSYFCAVFKKHFECTPKVYRNRP